MDHSDIDASETEIRQLRAEVFRLKEELVRCWSKGSLLSIQTSLGTMFSQAMGKRQESAYKKKISELSLLYEFSRMQFDPMDLGQAAGLMLERVNGHVPADALSAAVYEEDGENVGHYFFPQLEKIGPEFLAPSFSHEAAFFQILAGEIRLVSEVDDEDPLHRLKVRRHSKSFLFFPFIKSRMRMFFLLESLVSDSFTEAQRDFLAVLLSDAATTLENLKLHEDLHLMFTDTVKGLVQALEAKDSYTKGHSVRVREYALSIARRKGLNERQQEIVGKAAILHDIGKIGIEDQVLSNRQPLLSGEDRDALRKHPRYGAEILQPIKLLKEIVPSILYHHERYDGQGYPRGLQGDEIPIGAQIIAIVDAYDAMTTDRVYREGRSPGEAVEELRRCAGAQFNPELVEIFIQFLTEGKLL
ncbi:MAG: HD-GYP domain-containing protein [Armatimonadetes bacterium]|nr:HD-GYP domain-containing protein [Armatimonadota bacterium]